MATEVIMPKVDMVMDEGTFVEWLKEEGALVKKGDPLFIILTDKANIEIEAPASGTLAGVRAQPGDEIPVTEVIAYILEPDEPLPAGAEARLAAAPLADAPTGAPTALGPEAVTSPIVPPGPGAGKVRATPVARRLAAETGIDLAQVKGRGPRGRIHKADVLAFVERQPAVVEPGVAAVPVAPLRVPLPDARKKEVVPLAGPRKIIADRMAYSAFTAPHITLSLRVDMSEAARLRAQLLDPLRARTGQRLSFTAILARAVAAVLPRHPYLNASLDGEEIVLWDDVHLGIAMSVDDYLIVPVVREAQNKNLEQIVTDLGDLTERARTKRLVPSEMAGSTFTISNLGMFGVESFTAIVNPPESAILAVGKIVDTPVAAGEGIVLRPMMCLTICVDHRVVDGAAAARFLAELKDTLENPYLLI
jgi:pyruvate dehydrogenase E2 component (dihydrolipoamide acetyltransferase)